MMMSQISQAQKSKYGNKTFFLQVKKLIKYTSGGNL